MARSFCRIALLFVLTVLLAAPWSAAEGPRAGGESSPRILDQAWSWLSAYWSEIGCGIDPGGRCRDSSQGEPPNQIDIGCLIDPSGGCVQ